MEKDEFIGKYVRVTTEQIEDKIIERVHLGGSVHIILVTEEGKIRLATEKKLGRDELKVKFPAGIVETDEDPLDTAKRELKEELALEAESWEEFIRFDVNETINDFRVYYVARGLSQLENETDGEILSTKDVSIDELYDEAMSGNFSAIMQAVTARLYYQVQKGEFTLI